MDQPGVVLCEFVGDMDVMWSPDGSVVYRTVKPLNNIPAYLASGGVLKIGFGNKDVRYEVGGDDSNTTFKQQGNWSSSHRQPISHKKALHVVRKNKDETVRMWLRFMRGKMVATVERTRHA